MSKKIFNITSNNQNGGITAGEVQINLSARQRKLNPSLQNQLIQALRSDDEIGITAVMGNQEALTFAREIKDFLDEKGFAVKGVNQAIYTKPVIGQNLHRNGESNKVDLIVGEIKLQ